MAIRHLKKWEKLLRDQFHSLFLYLEVFRSSHQLMGLNVTKPDLLFFNWNDSNLTNLNEQFPWSRRKKTNKWMSSNLRKFIRWTKMELNILFLVLYFEQSRFYCKNIKKIIYTRLALELNRTKTVIDCHWAVSLISVGNGSAFLFPILFSIACCGAKFNLLKLTGC